MLLKLWIENEDVARRQNRAINNLQRIEQTQALYRARAEAYVDIKLNS